MNIDGGYMPIYLGQTWRNDPMITLYGIPNCDTVKKARTWLADHGVDYTFT